MDAVKFDAVTVLFTDFVEFSKLAVLLRQPQASRGIVHSRTFICVYLISMCDIYLEKGDAQYYGRQTKNDEKGNNHDALVPFFLVKQILFCLLLRDFEIRAQVRHFLYGLYIIDAVPVGHIVLVVLKGWAGAARSFIQFRKFEIGITDLFFQAQSDSNGIEM